MEAFRSARAGAVLCLAAAAGAGAAGDLPLLADVLFDICGVGPFELTPEHPCQYGVVGFAVAWEECAEAHTFGSGFRACLLGCATDALCPTVCSDAALADPVRCSAECGQLAQCVRDAAITSTGQASAEEAARHCFTGQAMRIDLVNGLPPRRKEAPAEAASNVTAGAVPVNGSVYHDLFPPGCEILASNGGADWRTVLEVPPEPDRLNVNELPLNDPVETPARSSEQFEAIIQQFEVNATPFPTAWHEERFNAFLGPEATLVQGPPLPPGLGEGDAWVQEAEEIPIVCPALVSVTGAELTEQAPRMQMYKMTNLEPGIHNEGRPVYRAVDARHYLYYWGAPLEVWRIGPDYQDSEAGVTSTHGRPAPCPNLAQGWMPWLRGGWEPRTPVRVVEVQQDPSSFLSRRNREPRKRKLLSGTLQH